MALLNNVPGRDLGNGTKPFSPPWTSFFDAVFNLLTAMTQSGTTAQRPTQYLWIGRRYFDSTLGKPVYVKSVGPVVWVDGVGTVS